MSKNDQNQAFIRKLELLIKEMSYYELTVLNKLVIERIRLMHKANTLISMSQFHVGDSVSWNGNDGIVRSGIIIRINQKTVSVRTRDGGYWKVSPQFLRKEY